MKKGDLVYCIKNSTHHKYGEYYNIFDIVNYSDYVMIYIKCTSGEPVIGNYRGYILDECFDEHFITLKDLRKKKIKKIYEKLYM